MMTTPEPADLIKRVTEQLYPLLKATHTRAGVEELTSMIVAIVNDAIVADDNIIEHARLTLNSTYGKCLHPDHPHACRYPVVPQERPEDN